MLHLSRYGQISGVVTGKFVEQDTDADKLKPFYHYYFVYFRQRGAATSLLRDTQGTLTIGAAQLNLAPSVAQKSRASAPPSVKEVASKYQLKHSEVSRALRDKRSVEECMNALVEATVIGQEEMRDREDIVEAVAKALIKYLKLGQCCVEPFGSTASGLGFRGCDLDLYADFGKSASYSRLALT